jgi:hypothetical protein
MKRVPCRAARRRAIVPLSGEQRGDFADPADVIVVHHAALAFGLARRLEFHDDLFDRGGV